MVNTKRKIEEKGQRTPRSTDVYGGQDGVKGGAYCDCGAVYRNKRWFHEDIDIKPEGVKELVCPACRRIADLNPAGIVSLSGAFFEAHEAEINNLITNTAQAAVTKNPLGRVMNISHEKDGVTITTTDVKLAHKIGRDVYKSYGGELKFVWNHAESPVRVTWTR